MQQTNNLLFKRLLHISASVLLLLATFGPISAQPAVAARCQQEPEERPGRPPRDKDPRRFSPEQFQRDIEFFISQQSGFTQAEAKDFFPIFFEMKGKQRNIQQKIERALERAAQSEGQERDYKRVITEVCQLRKQLSRVEDAYYQRLSKIVGYKKLVKALSADQNFGRRQFHKMTRGK